MRVPLQLAWSEVRTARSRTTSLLVAVVLGASCVVATAVLGATMQQQVEAGAGVEYAKADLLLRSQQGVDAGVDDGTSAGSEISGADLASIEDLAGVAAASPVVRTQAALAVDDQVRGALLETVPAPAFRWQQVGEGRLPTRDTEVALSSETLADLGVDVGDRVVLGTPTVGRTVFTVVGAVDVRGSLRYASLSYGIVTEPAARGFAGIEGYNEVQVRFTPDADPDAVVDAINATVPVGFPLLATDAVTATEQLYGSGLGVLGSLLAGFAVVAVVMAGLVLATVMSASLPARRADLAVLRAVGATRGQLRGAVVAETGGLAFAGGLVAIPLGIGLAALGVPLLGALPGVPSVSLDRLDVPVLLVAGVPFLAVLLGAAAALVPAWRVGTITPAEALRTSATTRPGTRRRVPVLVLLVISVVLLAVAARLGSLAGTAVAGLVVVVAGVAAAPLAARALAGVAAKVSRDRYPVAEMTAAQLRSFPERVTVTGLAATVAAAALALSWVVLASLGATVDERTLTEPGPQVMVGSYAGGAALAPGTTEQLAAVEGVASVLEIRSASAELSGPRPAGSLGSGSTTRLSGNITGLDADDLARVTDGRFPLDEVRTGTAYLPASDLPPFADGATVTVRGPAGSEKLTVVYVEDLPFQALVAPATLEAVGAVGTPVAAWVLLADGADRPAVVDDVRAVAVLAGGQSVSGSAPAQARVDEALALVRGLATGMLAISIAIAVLGAALTVAASVRQRSTELATLRLIGLDGRRVRALVAAETWVVASVSVLTGLLLGVLLGLAVVITAANALDLDPVLSVPVPWLLGIGVVVVAGIRLAVTGPLDRVSLLAPAQALRESGGR